MPDSERAYALCRLGGLSFAVPSEHVVQATLRPADIMEVPRRGEHSTQVFVQRGQVIPLLDLARLMPSVTQAPQEHTPDKVLVLRLDNRWLSIAIDQLVGMQRARDSQVVTVHHANTSEELFHSLLLPQGAHSHEQPICVLNIQTLFQWSGCWGPAHAPKDADADDGVKATNAGALYAVVKVQDKRFLIDTQVLAAVEPMPAVQRFGNDSTDVYGIARWRGRDVHVTQLGSLLGGRKHGNPPLLAILTDGPKILGLAIDEVHHIQRFPDDQLQSGATGGFPPHPALLGLMFDAHGERMLVLNARNMLALSAVLNTTVTEPSAARADIKQVGEPVPAHVVFQAGAQWAMPIHQIEAITSYPDPLDPCIGGHPAQCGSYNWRQHAVVLWDLKALSGAGPTTPGPECRVVLTKVHGQRVGVLTERLQMLLPARQGQISSLARNGKLITLLTVQREQQAQSFRVLQMEQHVPPAIFQ